MTLDELIAELQKLSAQGHGSLYACTNSKALWNEGGHDPIERVEYCCSAGIGNYIFIE